MAESRNLLNGANNPVRISYANLFKPRTPKGSTDAKYSVTLLIPKDNESLCKQFVNPFNELVEVVKAGNSGKLPKGFKRALKDGDAADENGETNKTFEGHWVISASNKSQPQLLTVTGKLTEDGKHIMRLANEEDIYSGCYCQLDLNYAIYSGDFNGISAYINGVCKIKDGERFGGASPTTAATFGGVMETGGLGSNDDDL